MTNQTFNLDLIPQGVPPIVHVSQYDKGQTWEIHLHENGIVFPVPANTSAAIQGTKPDNTGFQFPAVITAGDNVVMFTLEQQMTVFSGDIDCELVLVSGNDQVATINFILSVEPTTLDDDTVISETELPLIEQAAELGAVINGYATQIHADAETASTAATSASADATTATAAADDATASKTAAASSASNAATSETNAAASATAAASSETNAAASAAAAQAAVATDMTGATSSTAGAHGLVPAPAAGDNDKFLGGDGTWKDVTAELSGLTDVVLTNPSDGQLLRYDATAQKWKNAGVDSTPTANSANLVSSGGVKAQIDSINANKTNQTIIATRQANLTAVKAYVIGEQFIYNNTLYKATAAIAKNATITIGGNATTADNISSQISKIAKQLDDITVYKTDAYSGTTSSTSAVVGTVTNLPKGRYLVIPSGYSNFAGYMNAPVAGYVSNLGVIENPTQATYYVYSPTSSAATWTNYQVNFIKIG